VNDDLRRELEAAGRRDVPDVPGGFAVDLEDRLLALAHSLPTEEVAVASPAPAPSRRRTWIAAGTLVAATVVGVVLVVVAGFASVDRPGDRVAIEYELTDSINVEVLLADGTTLLDPDGLLLPDSAVITVGVGGSARIGEVVLRAGDVATLSDQDLRVVRAPGPGLAETPIGVANPTKSPSPTIRVSPSHPANATEPPVSRTSTPTDGPGATRSPGPSPTPTSRPKTDPPPKSAPPGSAKPSKKPVEIRPPHLRAKAIGLSKVGVRWTRTAGTRHYVLVATRSRDGAAADPTYPGSTVIGEFAHRPHLPLVFRVPRGITEIRLLVVALGPGGTELGRSNIVIVPLD
jgi:hypothetical protein